MGRIVFCNKETGQILYETRGDLSAGEALARAVADRTPLAGVDLRGLDLSRSALDGAAMAGADLSGANLTGANLSECDMRGCDFSDTDLYNACLCESDVSGAYFYGSAFGGTDIAGADMRGAVYDTLSCFSLDFITCASLRDSIFVAEGGNSCAFSRTPLVVRGMHVPLILLDRHVLMGHKILIGAEAGSRAPRLDFPHVAALNGYRARLSLLWDDPRLTAVPACAES